jgi:tetratricopeptide (TPR) repeat protein
VGCKNRRPPCKSLISGACTEFWHPTGSDPARHLRLSGALAWFWDRHSHLREGRERLGATLELDERGPDLARALTGAGILATSQGDTDAAFAHFADAIAIWQESGHELERALTLQSLAHAHFIAGQMQNSAERAEESLALLRRLAQPELADRAQLILAHALVAQGDVQRAEALAQEGLANALARDDHRSMYIAQHVLGDCALVGGDGELARDRYVQSLGFIWELGDRLYTCYELDHFAVALAACGDARRGLRLAAAATAQLDALRTELDKVTFWRHLRDRHLNRARTRLGADAETVWEEGRRLSLERAVEEALAPATLAAEVGSISA